MYRDSDHIDVSKAPCENRKCCRRRKKENKESAYNGTAEMYDAIGQPCKDIEDDAFVRRKNVAQVRAIEDILQGRKHPNPDRWSILAWNKSEMPVSHRSRRMRRRVVGVAQFLAEGGQNPS